MSKVQSLKAAPRFAVTGVRPGPVLVVIGTNGEIEAAADHLSRVPSLGYMRGRLQLWVDDGSAAETAGDEYLMLAPQNALERSFTPADAHWRILGYAAELGMIDGRGVPASYQVNALDSVQDTAA